MAGHAYSVHLTEGEQGEKESQVFADAFTPEVDKDRKEAIESEDAYWGEPARDDTHLHLADFLLPPLGEENHIAKDKAVDEVGMKRKQGAKKAELNDKPDVADEVEEKVAEKSGRHGRNIHTQDGALFEVAEERRVKEKLHQKLFEIVEITVPEFGNCF